MKGSLLNPIGWIKRKKRGVTLVEVILSIFIATLIIGIGNVVILNSFRFYRGIITTNSQRDSFDDGIISIDRILKGNMIKDVLITENSPSNNGEIKVTYYDVREKDRTTDKVIKLDKEGKKIIVETYRSGIPKRTGLNVILRGVREMNIVKKGKLYYLTIIMEGGEKRSQCI